MLYSALKTFLTTGDAAALAALEGDCKTFHPLHLGHHQEVCRSDKKYTCTSEEH